VGEFNEEKSYAGVHTVWKCLINAFSILIKWVAWKVGNGERVRVGDGPWIGCVGNYKLSKEMKESLQH